VNGSAQGQAESAAVIEEESKGQDAAGDEAGGHNRIANPYLH